MDPAWAPKLITFIFSANFWLLLNPLTFKYTKQANLSDPLQYEMHIKIAKTKMGGY